MSIAHYGRSRRHRRSCVVGRLFSVPAVSQSLANHPLPVSFVGNGYFSSSSWLLLLFLFAVHRFSFFFLFSVVAVVIAHFNGGVGGGAEGKNDQRVRPTDRPTDHTSKRTTIPPTERPSSFQTFIRHTLVLHF